MDNWELIIESKIKLIDKNQLELVFLVHKIERKR